MGIAGWYKEKRQLNFNKKLHSYMRGGAYMEYNPLLFGDKSLLTSNRYTYRLKENSIWYGGIDSDLRYFYKTTRERFRTRTYLSDRTNMFWTRTNDNIRKLHSGLPQLISEKMVDLIVGNGYRVMLEGESDDVNQDRLEEIAKANRLNIRLQEGIETESWSGGVPMKISFNPMLSEYPVIEVVQPEFYSQVTVNGRVIQDIFTSYPEDAPGDDVIRFKEIYGTDADGSYIDYKLEKQKDDEWVEIPIETVPSVANKQPFRLSGYFKKFSLYKPNKLPNSEFRGSTYGESDYSGSIGAFDGIDEILSTWIQEFRDGKLTRYFPEHLFVKNKQGNNMIPDEFEKDYMIYDGSIAEGSKDSIEYRQATIDTNKHIESYRMWMMIALNNGGLSPLTIGMTGLEAMNAGEQSQKEREKVSIRTREKKISLWTEFLNDFMERVMVFDDVINSMVLNEDGTMGEATYGEYEVNTIFNDYILKSKADRTTEATEGVSGMTWDIKSAVDYIHDDKTDKEKLSIVANIKLENNIDAFSVAEASALKATEEIAQEELREDGVEILEIDEEVEEEIIEEDITEVEEE